MKPLVGVGASGRGGQNAAIYVCVCGGGGGCSIWVVIEYGIHKMVGVRRSLLLTTPVSPAAVALGAFLGASQISLSDFRIVNPLC